MFYTRPSSSKCNREPVTAICQNLKSMAIRDIRSFFGVDYLKIESDRAKNRSKKGKLT